MSIIATLKDQVEKWVGISMPPRSYFEEWEEAVMYTPDVWHLERFEKVWLFVYGEEMSKHRKNVELLGLHEPEGTAFTFENFTMWKHVLGKESYPVVLDKSLDCEQRNWFKIHNALPQTKIKGELYLVPPRVIFELDKYKENGVKYDRKRIQLILPYRSSQFPGIRRQGGVKAYTYIGKHSYWQDPINTGAQLKTFAPVRSFLDEVEKIKIGYKNRELTEEEFIKKMKLFGFNESDIKTKKHLSFGKHYYYFTLAECMKSG